MNKTIRNFGIASLVMALTSTAAIAGGAQGGRYYVGAGVGTSMGQHKMGTTFTYVGAPNVAYPDNRKYSKRTSIAGGIFGGYLHNVNVFSLGAELGVTVGSEKSRLVTTLGVPGAILNYEFRLARQYTIRATTKLGLNLSDDFAVYVLLGAANSRFKLYYVDHILNGSYNSAQSKNLWAFSPGAEVNYNIDRDWSVGVTYTCDVYQPFKSGQFTQSTGAPPFDFFQTNVRPVYHTVMARVNYSF